MPYITTEEVKEIRNAIKKAYPEYKFSITKRHHSSVDVNIMSGPLDICFEGNSTDNKQIMPYDQVKRYGEEEAKLYQGILDIVDGKKKQEELVYDGDYGSVPNYYKNLEVGKWDKPYICTAA